VAGARVAAGGTRQRLILWRSSLRYDFAKRLGLGTAPYNSLRAFGSSLKQVRRVSYEALRARPQAKPLRRHRNRRRRVPPAAPREWWYSTGGVPTLSRQIRVRVGHAAQSDDAPAMSGFALGAKRFVNILISPV